MLNVIRVCRVIEELKTPLDEVTLNDGNYQFIASVDHEKILSVYAFDCTDGVGRKGHRVFTYNTRAPSYMNQVFRALADLDVMWDLGGSLPSQWAE